MSLDAVPFYIGRGNDNHLVLRDSRTSRKHARIVQVNDDYFIEDLDSRHGVYVNGVKVSRQKLASGDKSTFGVSDSYELLFSASEREELTKLLGQFQAPAAPDSPGGRLARLRALVEVARTLQNALTMDESSPPSSIRRSRSPAVSAAF